MAECSCHCRGCRHVLARAGSLRTLHARGKTNSASKQLFFLAVSGPNLRVCQTMKKEGAIVKCLKCGSEVAKMGWPKNALVGRPTKRPALLTPKAVYLILASSKQVQEKKWSRRTQDLLVGLLASFPEPPPISLLNPQPRSRSKETAAKDGTPHKETATDTGTATKGAAQKATATGAAYNGTATDTQKGTGTTHKSIASTATTDIAQQDTATGTAQKGTASADTVEKAATDTAQKGTASTGSAQKGTNTKDTTQKTTTTNQTTLNTELSAETTTEPQRRSSPDSMLPPPPKRPRT